MIGATILRSSIVLGPMADNRRSPRAPPEFLGQKKELAREGGGESDQGFQGGLKSGVFDGHGDAQVARG